MTTTRSLARLAFVIAGLALLGGCSTIGQIVEREDAASTESSLAAAGFEILPADTAERVAELDEMPHFKLVTRRDGGKVIYAYADPVNCHCEYVGDEQQHAEYERQRSEQRLAYERREAQHLEEEMTLDTDARAPGPALW
jgi:hypothetical protein